MTATALQEKIRTGDSRFGIEAAARALCAADFFRITDPITRQQYIDAQWPTYVTRAEAAVKAYMEAAT